MYSIVQNTKTIKPVLVSLVSITSVEIRYISYLYVKEINLRSVWDYQKIHDERINKATDEESQNNKANENNNTEKGAV